MGPLEGDYSREGVGDERSRALLLLLGRRAQLDPHVCDAELMPGWVVGIHRHRVQALEPPLRALRERFPRLRIDLFGLGGPAALALAGLRLHRDEELAPLHPTLELLA